MALKTIIIGISRGYAIRDFILSGMADKLLKHRDIRILFLVPSARLAQLKQMLPDSERISTRAISEISSYLNFWEKIIWGISYRVRKNRFLFPISLKINNRLYNLFAKRCYDKLFERYRPSLVVTSNPGYHSKNDLQLLREAQHNHCKTLSIIPSWDNLVEKSILQIFPDFLTVWNEMVKKEAMDIYYYPEKNIAIVGPIQFDFYQRKDICLSKERFFKKNGLDMHKRLITLILSTREWVGDQTFLLDILEEAEKKNLFVEPVQFVCRLHPHDSTELFELYKKRKSFTIEQFQCKDEHMGWSPDLEESIHKANLLKHSDVVINVLSTMCIEAAVFDTPVVDIQFGDSEEMRGNIVKRCKLHFRHIVNKAGLKHVKSREELIAGINEYLISPGLDYVERKEFAEHFCYRLDGMAHKRVADLIAELAREG